MTGAEAVPGALLTGAAGWAFVVFAVLALGMAVAVVVARNPIHSALFLLSSFLLVACIFVLEQVSSSAPSRSSSTPGGSWCSSSS
jgi:apolipoprotein N-acyltransferase